MQSVIAINHYLSEFGMNTVEKLQSPAGRLLRVLFGVAVISFFFFQEGWPSWGMLGFIPVVTGSMGSCLIAPLFGYTAWGEKKAPKNAARRATEPAVIGAPAIHA
jgi:hypothetical protein